MELRSRFGVVSFGKTGILLVSWANKATAEVTRKYIEYHRHEEKTPKQLELF